MDALLAQPFANWHVDTTTETHQLRVTKKGVPMLHTSTRDEEVELSRDHDRRQGPAARRGPPGAQVALGISDAQGRVKPTRQAKYRQVEEFVRLLAASLDRGARPGPRAHAHDRRPAAHRRPRLRQRLPHLRRPPLPHRTRARVARATGAHDRGRRQAAVGRPQLAVAADLGIDADFVVGSIADAAARRGRPTSCSRCTPATPPPTTRSARARRVARRRWCSRRRAATTTSPPSCAPRRPPAPYAMLTRHGILRERFADTLTDALRASLLRREGYRVDVVEFVESAHTPRNTLLRAVRTGTVGDDAAARLRRPARRVGRTSPAGRAAASRGTEPCRAASPDARRRCGPAVPARRVCRGTGAGGHPAFRFTDPDIVESSGLAVGRRPRGHHQRLRRLRPGVHRRPRHRRARWG